eukprot:5128616-Pleurochrysis_carterae.AAC.2
MGAEAPPTEGDSGQPRPEMIAAWRPSGLVRAKPPPPVPPQREASCSPAPPPLAPVRPTPDRDAQHGSLDRQPHFLNVGALSGHLHCLALATTAHRNIRRGTCTV